MTLFDFDLRASQKKKNRTKLCSYKLIDGLAHGRDLNLIRS